MESASKRSGPACAAEATVVLPRVAAGHLHSAFEQMDLLLATRQVDVGLCCLVDLLCSLRALKAHLHVAGSDGAAAAQHATTD